MKTRNLRTLLAAPFLYTGRKFLSLSERLAGRRFNPVVEAWRSDRGDATLRQDYDLSGKSLVLDLGGYQGQWASDIYARYRCAIHIFEPVPQFAEAIKARFARNPSITVHAAALGPTDCEARIALNDDGSHLAANGGVPVLVKRADTFIDSLGAPAIDLVKINIEGAEYDLLEHLLNTGHILQINNLQIQFHRFVPNAVMRRDNIRKKMSTTHELTYEYEFVWENWRKRT